MKRRGWYAARSGTLVLALVVASLGAVSCTTAPEMGAPLEEGYAWGEPDDAAADESYPEEDGPENGNGAPKDEEPPDPGVTVVSVFYGTDRDSIGTNDAGIDYGGGRGQFTYGRCKVSIPPDHERGVVERPFKIWRFEFPEDPRRHCVLLQVVQDEKDAFFEKLANRVGLSDSLDAFVFVHGYNVTFETAALRTAQMWVDLEFEGAPIFYSWPSQGSPGAYGADVTDVAWTIPHLKEFLLDVAERSGARTVHLIGHSLGNEALTWAFKEVAVASEGIGSVFREIVLAAPDIDPDIFREQIAPYIASAGFRVTVYASSRDKALELSEDFRLHHRLGDCDGRPVIVADVDTIDATAVDTSFWGHEYFSTSSSVISDLLLLLRDGLPPSAREGLEPIESEEGIYWRFEEQR